MPHLRVTVLSASTGYSNHLRSHIRGRGPIYFLRYPALIKHTKSELWCSTTTIITNTSSATGRPAQFYSAPLQSYGTLARRLSHTTLLLDLHEDQVLRALVPHNLHHHRVKARKHQLLQTAEAYSAPSCSYRASTTAALGSLV